MPEDEKPDIAALNRKLNMLTDLQQHEGWKWLTANMTDSRRSWEKAVRETLPDGAGGSAKLARAQGALIALEQVLGFPQATAAAIERFLRTGQTQEDDA